MTPELEQARAELSELTRSLRAHLERLTATGATALPPAPADAASASPPASPPSPSPPRSPSSIAHSPAPPTTTPARSPTPASLPAPPPARAPSPASLDAPAAHRLHVLSERVSTCTRCALHSARTQTVFARGTGAARLCFVGEGPGADEDAQGLPFVGKAGQLLDRMIAAMGFDRDEVYVANIVKCRPPNNRKPEPDEMAACMPFLAEQLEVIDPEVIVALGATAVQGLLGITEGITRLRGKWRLYQGKIAVMPTFHPAYLLRTPAAKRDVWEDLQAVLRHMGRPIPERK